LVEAVPDFMASHAPHYQALGTGHKVVVVNAKNGEHVRDIKTGKGPLELVLSKDGTVAGYDTATSMETRR